MVRIYSEPMLERCASSPTLGLRVLEAGNPDGPQRLRGTKKSGALEGMAAVAAGVLISGGPESAAQRADARSAPPDEDAD